MYESVRVGVIHGNSVFKLGLSVSSEYSTVNAWFVNYSEQNRLT